MTRRTGDLDQDGALTMSTNISPEPLLTWITRRADELFATGAYTRGTALIMARDEARRIITDAVRGTDRGPRARCPICGRWAPLAEMRTTTDNTLICADCHGDLGRCPGCGAQLPENGPCDNVDCSQEGSG
jgi:hypothetical protein